MQPLRQGTLYKPPRDGKPGLMRARHFVLHARSLEWFVDSSCRRPRGSMEITHEMSVTLQAEKCRLSLESMGHRLTLSTQPPWYMELLQAHQPAGGCRFVLEAWRQSICEAIDTARQRPLIAIAQPVTIPASVVAMPAIYAGDSAASTPPRTAAGHVTLGTIDLNSASAAELAALPGIGAQRATAIVDHRLVHGRFRDVDGLDAVRGVGPSTIAKLRARAHCGGSAHSNAPLPPPPLPPPTPPQTPLPTASAGAGAGARHDTPNAVAYTTGDVDAAMWRGPLRAPKQAGARPQHAHTALFFPDHRLPCECYLAGVRCSAPRCRLAHHETGLTRVLRVVGEAQTTLDVAVYCISLDLLADALLHAHARGVRIRIITDDEQLKASGAEVARLEAGGIVVRTDSSPRLHMHHKFVVVDGTALLCGSFNFTRGAASGNFENALISRVPSLARRFASEFERLWVAFGTPGGAAGVAPACDGFEDGAAVLFFPSAAGHEQTRWVIEILQRANKRIDVAVFTLTHDGLVDALIEKHRRGVVVRVITDNRQSRVTGADAPRLREAGVPVRIDSSYYAMHHKFCVIDGGDMLLSGSFNWTSQAEKGNQENLVIYRRRDSESPPTSPGPAFAQEFERLWAKFMPKASAPA